MLLHYTENVVPETRICTVCQNEKPLDSFSRQAKGKWGRQSACKYCIKAKYQSTPIQKEKYRAYVRDYRTTPGGMLQSFKAGALKRGLDFELTLERIAELQDTPCHYCGQAGPNGIDRLDNEDGYTVLNSVACCKTCNKMKYTYTPEAFVVKCRQIASRFQR